MSRIPLTPTILALSIVAASAVGLWWLLRRESRATLLWVALLSALALAVRVVYTEDFPRGFNEDEQKVLYNAAKAAQNETLLAESVISVPILMHALFNGLLVPLLGPGRWAIRGYSLVGGVLCIPAAFAAARALQLAVAPSLAAAGLIVVLPWALFYSRVMQGTELNFQQLLLIAALARLVFTRPVEGGAPSPPGVGDLVADTAPTARRPPQDSTTGWREFALGSFALAWLLYGYWCTRSMLGMPLVAAVLARGWRRRLACLAIAVAAVLLYAPYLYANRNSMFIAQGVNPAYYASYGNLAHLGQRTLDALSAFVWPVAEDGWLTIRTAALHPWPLLVVAAVGAFVSVRRGLFLLGGFFGGLAPAVLAWGPFPSTHRMLMAFPFVALAAGCALNSLLAWPRLTRWASAVLVVAVGAYSIPLYFSERFWPLEARWKFDWQRTALIDSLPLPPGPPVVIMRQLEQFHAPRALLTSNDQILNVDNWLPGEQGAVYAFTDEVIPLRAFYENLLGPRRVESFGYAFKVTLEPGDWSWLRQHGWSYEAGCTETTARGQVPVLYQTNFTFGSLLCYEPVRHTWHGRWVGPSTSLRLHSGDPATVDAGAKRFESAAGAEPIVDFTAEPGMDIRITITTMPQRQSVSAMLFERTPAGDRLPAWDRVVPVP